MLRTRTLLVALAVTCLLVAGATQSGTVREGGTFRVALPVSAVESIDPFLNSLVGMTSLFDASCGSLLHRKDEPLPHGSELTPELAEAAPAVSTNGRTYTFRVARGHRFSTGAPVTARDVAATVRRALRLKGSDAAPSFMNVVGARAFSRDRTEKLTGVTVRGNAITFQLRKPRPDFGSLAGQLCVLPATLPLDDEGASAPVPSAGPYIFEQYVPGRRIVLERNRFYRGPRTPHVDRFDVSILDDPSTFVEDVERGTYDWAFTGTAIGPQAERLAARYGVNRQRFFVTRGRGINMLHLNASQPLFHHNVRLRRAVNFALDRKALVREIGPRSGAPADQYLQPNHLAYRDAHIYPFTPNVRKAAELAAGNRRGGKVVFYIRDEPVGHALGAIVRDNLAKIGLDVELKAFPRILLFELLAKPGEPWDIGWINWLGSSPDWLALHDFFDGRTLDDPENYNRSFFNSPRVNRRLDEVSDLTGPAFYRAYGELDDELARDYAPAFTLAYLNELTLVSTRTSCVVNNPFIVLAVACLE
jgi:ABC-type transport system substrate-binding protein